LVRVEETLTTDAATGAEVVVHRVEMVGDHIMVKLRPGVTEQDLTTLIGRLGGHIRSKCSVRNRTW